MQYPTRSIEGYRVSTDRYEIDIDAVFAFISNSYWAEGIPKKLLVKAINNSLCFSIFDQSNAQVGFARVITDTATFAYLADVYIVDEHRGKGLSKMLVETIVNHAELQGLRRFMLATSDAHGLYQQYGFSSMSRPEMMMEIAKPDVYKTTE